MAVLVSELTTKVGAEFTNNDKVLVVDPSTQDLYTVAAEEFRGSSVFVSPAIPTSDSSSQGVTTYKKGDVYYQNTEEGITIYHWDQDNTQWVSDGRLDGSRIWTQDDFGRDDLEDELNTFDNTAFDDGDYFLNKKRGILYGPYNRAAVAGFPFGTTDYNFFQHIRGATQFVYTYVGAAGFHRPENNIPVGEQNVNNQAWLPRHGDTIWVQKDNGNSHGGYIYTFDETVYKASAAVTHANRLAEAWGYVPLDIGGGTAENPDTPEGNSSRRYYREASLIVSKTGAPVWDTDSYRDGDSVLNPEASVIFRGFKEFLNPADDDTTDLGVVFDDQESLQGSAILNTDTAPVRDDTIYKDGEFIITTSDGTTRMHGPYKFGATDDVDAWPLASVIRPPYEHKITATAYDNGNGVTYPDEYTSDYPIYDNVMVVDGDIITIVYGPEKEVTLSDGCVIDYTGKTINWGTTLTNRDSHQVHVSNTSGRPSQNDAVYYAGDLFKNSVGDVYGPYVEGAVDDAAAWPSYYSLAPSKEITITDTWTSNYTLTTTNSSATWGGDYLNEGDKVTVKFTGSTRDKYRVFEVASVAGDDTITWDIRQPDAGKVIYLTIKDHPNADDISYYAGDIAITESGIAYRYVEDQASKFDSWEFAYYARSPREFVNVATAFTSDIGTYNTAQTNTDTDTFKLIPGDKIVYQTAEGKKWFIQVDTVDHKNEVVTFTSAGVQNYLPTRTWQTAETGQPALNDVKYSDGDFVITADSELYGPYVSGESVNSDAWPLDSSLKGEIEFVDGTTSDVYVIEVDNGELFLNLKP